MGPNTPIAFREFTESTIRNADALRRGLNEAFKLVMRGFQTAVGTLQSTATPSVAGAAVWKTNNTSAVSITSFKQGVPAQGFVLIAQDGNTTLVHGTNLQLNGSVNVTLANGACKQFVTMDGTTFYEVPR